MRIGIQTISWGVHKADLPTLFKEIKTAGYDGVEFAYPPGLLGHPKELSDRLRDYELTFLGIAGGSLKDRIEFVKKFCESARPPIKPYVYLDEWQTPVAAEAIKDGVVLAIHPHMFKPIQTSADADELFRAHSGYASLRFMPDTGHLTVAGEDVLDVIGRFFNRIDAVHLKDWSAEFGRAYQFYSRGFVPLGHGDVPLTDVINFLKVRRYGGWLVVEQDVSPNPVHHAEVSRRWLAGFGI